MPRKSQKTLEQPPIATKQVQAARLITSLAASIAAGFSAFDGDHRESQRQLAIEGGLR